MATVFAGVSEELSRTHPATAPLRDLSQAARLQRNAMLYIWRQVWFTNKMFWWARKKLPLPSFTQLAQIGRGELALRDNALVPAPGEILRHGLIGGSLADRVHRDLVDSLKAFLATHKIYRDQLQAYLAAGTKSDPPVEPQPPGYVRKFLTLNIPAKHLKFSDNCVRVRLNKPSSSAGIRVPDLTVPFPLRTGLLSGESRLVSVAVQALPNGGVKLTWTTKETGRAGVSYPSAPADLTSALNSGLVASVDLGIRNLLALSISDLRHTEPALVSTRSTSPTRAVVPPSALPAPLLVRGARLIDICSRSDRQVIALNAALPFKKGGKKKGQLRVSRNILLHHARRGRQIDAAIRELLQPVFKRLLAHDVKSLVLGWNPGVKSEIETGRRNNRRFGSIPFARVREVLAQFCERYGILYVETREDHTSKTSFLDGEAPVHHSEYVGRRVTREIFRSAAGRRINADVNASLQILEKALAKEKLSHRIDAPTRQLMGANALNPVSTR